MAQATWTDWESGSGGDGNQGKGTGKGSGNTSDKGKGKGSDTKDHIRGTSSDSWHWNGNSTWHTTDNAGRGTGWSSHSWSEPDSHQHNIHAPAQQHDTLQPYIDKLEELHMESHSLVVEAKSAADFAQGIYRNLRNWEASFFAEQNGGVGNTCQQWCPLHPDLCLRKTCPANPVRQLINEALDSHEQLCGAMERLTAAHHTLHAQVQTLVLGQCGQCGQSGQMPATSSSTTSGELAQLRARVNLMASIIGNLLTCSGTVQVPPQLQQHEHATMHQHMQPQMTQPQHQQQPQRFMHGTAGKAQRAHGSQPPTSVQPHPPQNTDGARVTVHQANNAATHATSQASEGSGARASDDNDTGCAVPVVASAKPDEVPVQAANATPTSQHHTGVMPVAVSSHSTPQATVPPQLVVQADQQTQSGLPQSDGSHSPRPRASIEQKHKKDKKAKDKDKNKEDKDAKHRSSHNKRSRSS